MIKTVTTAAGVNTVSFDEFYKYFWIKNIGDTIVYASAYTNVAAGVDNTSVIDSGGAVCIENVDNNNVYISGAGSVEIHAQDYPDCPFKVVKKGGENSGLKLDENARFTGDVVFPEGVKTIPNSYFFTTGVEYTGAVTSITFPTTLTSLGVSAIRYVPTLQAVNFKGNNLKTIGDYCFMADPNLKELILPDGVETIGNGAIGYINIEKLHLPASCISIHNSAFASDTKLTNVTVGVGFNCNLNISAGTFTADIINNIIANYAYSSGKTLTIGSANLAKLSDDEKAVATAKGLTLA